MRPPATLAVVVALAACEREESASERALAAPAPVKAAAEPPATVRTGSVGFAGHWGTDPARCAEAHYVLTRTALEAPGGYFCSFRRVEETADGWRIEATCDGRSLPVGIDRIGDGLRLRISGREPVTVRLCPENWAASVPAPAARDVHDRAAAIDRRIAAGGRELRPYEFKHEGVLHQAWRENDQVLKIAEKTLQGEVLWWFAPGAEEPFLVRSGGGGAAFERGRPLEGWGAPPDEAARLLARGRALRLAADG